jgi:hypothetical protein
MTEARPDPIRVLYEAHIHRDDPPVPEPEPSVDQVVGTSDAGRRSPPTEGGEVPDMNTLLRIAAGVE